MLLRRSPASPATPMFSLCATGMRLKILIIKANQKRAFLIPGVFYIPLRKIFVTRELDSRDRFKNKFIWWKRPIEATHAARVAGGALERSGKLFIMQIAIYFIPIIRRITLQASSNKCNIGYCFCKWHHTTNSANNKFQ